MGMFHSPDLPLCRLGGCCSVLIGFGIQVSVLSEVARGLVETGPKRAAVGCLQTSGQVSWHARAHPRVLLLRADEFCGWASVSGLLEKLCFWAPWKLIPKSIGLLSEKP